MPHANTGIPLEERFWMKVDKSGDCWVWTANVKDDGYGRFRISPRKLAYAHRVAWEWQHGPVPEGMVICHRCDNPPCVRIDHLFLGTSAENANDSMNKGRHYQANKTHCPHGHPYAGANLGVRANGERRCRTCDAADMRRRTALKH